MGIGTLTLAWLLAATPLPPDVVPLKDREFLIPIKVDAARKHEIRQLILLASPDQGKTWNQHGTAEPDKDGFPFTAPSDGLYYFTICIVDQKGNKEPNNPYSAPVGLKILVDTVKPEIRMSAVRDGENVIASWEVVEEYPNLATLRMEYRADPQGPWNAVQLTPEVRGQAGFRAGAGPVTVRMQVADQAGNIGATQADVAAGTPGAPLPTMPGAPLPPPSRDAGSWPPIQAPGQPVAMVRNQRPLEPVDPAPPRDGSGSLQPAGGLGSQVVASSGGQAAPGGVPSAVAPGPALAPQRGPLPPLQYINSAQLTLQYEVAKYGASGVGSVELYVTRNDGATWELLGGEQNLNLPPAADPRGAAASVQRSLSAKLPGEGTYGFYLIVRSGVGLGKPPPKNGDAPLMRVEVDTTPPEATLYRLDPVPGKRDTLLVSWSAKDRNLTATPITLEWAERRDGRWENLASRELPNDGRYEWKVPPTVPAKVYLRLTVRDLAGNTGVAETPEPVTVDLNEPEVRFIGLGAGGR